MEIVLKRFIQVDLMVNHFLSNFEQIEKVVKIED